MNSIEWLENWYQQNCNGIWEHSYGIEIGTLDNPGWYVNIDLKETEYDNLQMKELEQEQGNSDWVRCSIKDGVFRGVGAGLKLHKIIDTFREAIQSYENNCG